MSDINITGTVSTSQDYTNSYRNQMQESLIDAINILYKGAVAKENISKTLECVISDASERDKGIYKVDYMKNIFEVSCPLSTVYDVGDAVFVLVPDGDFSKTKIIVQGSLVAGFHLNKKTNIDSNDFKTFKEYNISKMCVEAYTYKLMKEKPYSNIDFVLTEPGITSTSITRDLDSFLKHVGKVFVSTFFHSVDKASLTLLEAVSSKATHGSYIVPRGLFTISGYPKYKKFPHKREREYLIK